MREYAHIKRAVPDADEIESERTAAIEAIARNQCMWNWGLPDHEFDNMADGVRAGTIKNAEIWLARLESRGYTVRRMTDGD